MAATSDPELLVLHGLRLKSFASAGVVAELTGLSEGDVQSQLDEAQARELVKYREGAITGWMLLPAGRARADELIAAQLDASGDARTDIDAAYRQFLTLNQGFLHLCTDWQLRPVEGGDPVTNDHSDAAYDTNVIGRLAALDAEAQPICNALAATLDRFRGYAPRFTRALAAVQAGDVDFFTKPMIDSYHTIWFELHEDLLRTLGIERGSES